MAPRKTAEKPRAPRNRTLQIEATEIDFLNSRILRNADSLEAAENRIICGDAFKLLRKGGRSRFDLLFADPPYNLTKAFGNEIFHEMSDSSYREWLNSWLRLCVPLLKPTASVYICGDWRSASTIQSVGSKYFKVRNRITWEREKGRGAKANWKNTAEDIWFFTVSDEFTFNADAVKQRRRVIAPYRENGRPKDWIEDSAGNFRDTAPSNIWTDIAVPFWSMAENTNHPTQKPEKLLAKIILASTDPGDLILDPFAGSGTTAVTAKKLDRRFVAIEADYQYCLLGQKRLDLADNDSRIQGYSDGVFWERNTSSSRPRG